MMSIPDYQTIMLPLLAFAADGKEHATREAATSLSATLGLSEQEQKQLYPTGKKAIFLDRVEWAKTYLKQAGLLHSPRRTYFAITTRGLDVLAKNPVKVDVKYLRQFAEFQEFEGRTRSSPKAQPKPSLEGSPNAQTPKEAIDYNYQQLREALAQELLEGVKKQPPDFFEVLVVKLLVAMGYGGSIADAGQAVGKSGDGGIDGIIKEDKLGLDAIYIQAKRWGQGTVGRPDIQGFVGALEGRTNKGVFITTSEFTTEARNYAKGLNTKKIVLIDGKELAQLMIDYNIGVTKDAVYEIKRVDADFFGEM